MGVRFNNQTILSNSRLALMGGEYAKEKGQYYIYHELIFKAYFTDCQNIGELTVLQSIAAKLGFDVNDFSTALESEQYLSVLTKTSETAKTNSVTAAPTFFVGDLGKITGAKPIEEFIDILKGGGAPAHQFIS